MKYVFKNCLVEVFKDKHNFTNMFRVITKMINVISKLSNLLIYPYLDFQSDLSMALFNFVTGLLTGESIINALNRL